MFRFRAALLKSPLQVTSGNTNRMVMTFPKINQAVKKKANSYTKGMPFKELVSGLKKGDLELMLGYSIQTDMMDLTNLLLRHVADFNPTSALVYAISKNNLPMSELFLRHGADPNASLGINKTILLQALKSNNDDIARLLISHGAVKATNRIHRSQQIVNAVNPLSRDYAEIVEAGVCHIDSFPVSEKYEILERAVRDGFRDEVRAVLQTGDIDPNDKRAQQALLLSVRQNQLPSTALLLKHGIDPNNNGITVNRTPLMTAIEADNTDMVHLLIEYGAIRSLIIRGKSGRYSALSRLHKKSTSKQMLLNQASSLYLGSNEKTVAALRSLTDEQKNDIAINACSFNCGDEVTALLQTGYDINSRLTYMRVTGSMLHIAVEREAYEVVKVLMERGVDPFILTSQGFAARRYAATREMQELLYDLTEKRHRYQCLQLQLWGRGNRPPPDGL
eukprot:TRINITY_DN37286_c0_g1_i1.p1 TRINITY_DN37286_c0_g1~~TRINITY_DN37286_c0_g1_i1.p1  ORF type:complete len:462 (+),score=52.95 TRINITY_DN37286_c0_g1_i1:44-1387(+)